jgi:hypothetical protein
VTATGNPHDIFFAHVNGYVTSGPQSLGGSKPFFERTADKDPARAQDIGYWKDAYVFVMPVFPGFSGGPVYSSDGRVVGLVVGILGDTSYSIVEPVSKICDLLPDLNAKPDAARSRPKSDVSDFGSFDERPGNIRVGGGGA